MMKSLTHALFQKRNLALKMTALPLADHCGLFMSDITPSLTCPKVFICQERAEIMRTLNSWLHHASLPD